MWNKPVSSYFRRHVFSPLMGRGWKFNRAAAVVFTVSALLHELAVGIPTHNVIGECSLHPTDTLLNRLQAADNRPVGIAFLGMLVQLPLIVMTRPFEKATSPAMKMIGNCFFWVSFTILGQPFAALCYFYAWQIKYGSISEKWTAETSS